MEIFERWKDIEPLLKEKKAEVNVFYTEEYYNLEVGRGNRCIYIFDDRGLILVVIWRRLIYNWGVMPSEPVYFLEVDEKAFLNDVMEAIKGKIYWLNQTGATAAEVDQEVMSILKNAYEEAKRLLSENRDIMDKIAEFLIEKETITGKEFMKIFRECKGIIEENTDKEADGVPAV